MPSSTRPGRDVMSAKMAEARVAPTSLRRDWGRLDRIGSGDQQRVDGEVQVVIAGLDELAR